MSLGRSSEIKIQNSGNKECYNMKILLHYFFYFIGVTVKNDVHFSKILQISKPKINTL